MDQTTLPPSTTPTKDTAIKTGPPLNTNGAAVAVAAPTAEPKMKTKSLARVILERMASLRITVALFLLSMVLVFWGTLAQEDFGVWTIVQKYFRSAVVMVPLKVVLFNTVDVKNFDIPFPGGWLIGFAMLFNLLAAHAVRFKLAWNRTGILLIHAGIIVMMFGELITGLYAIEGNMVIAIGQKSNVVTEAGKAEFAIIRTLSPTEDEVITIPAPRLKAGTTVEDDKLPFKIEVLQYMVNSDIHDFVKGMTNPAKKGSGRFQVAHELPEVNGIDPNQRHDAPSAYAKILTRDGKNLGTWLFTVNFEQPEWIDIDGKKYQVALRFKQSDRKFTLQLNKFVHAVFPGTDTPKDFHSYAHLTDPETGEDRDVEIYMNHPLSYRGETFYQASWTTDPRTGKANGTVLQVVRNPGWSLPYISCAIVGCGLLLHFGQTLSRFLQRRIVR